MKINAYITPGALVAGTRLVKNDGDVIKEAEYRKIVGKLLWSTRKDLPDCANADHKLLNHMFCCLVS